MTAAATAPLLGWTHVDLDVAIEQAAQSTCAELVAADESAFRQLEIETLAEILQGDRQIISAGGGLQTIPRNVLVVWLQRDGWEETAEAERVRLRPQLSWEDEVAWMCTTREPAWLTAAHLHIRVPRAREAERVARDLATYVGWIEAGLSEFATKTWVVASNRGDLERATHDASMFAFAGVEVRSDVFTEPPSTTTPLLASLRTKTTSWLRDIEPQAAAFDVDIALLDELFASGILQREPRPLLLSTHPSQVDPDDVTALVAALRRIRQEAAAWLPHVAFKYAPHVNGVADIGVGRALTLPLRRAGFGVTYLPQGADAAWVRPLLLADNRTNYITTRLRPTRAGLDDDALTPWDLVDWLPHLAAPMPTVWDVLVGDPVEQSQGDLWHRRAAIEANEPAGYVKAKTREADFEATLSLLAELGVRGVSVTSPLKLRVAFIATDDAAFGELLTDEGRWAAAKVDAPIRTGNTLVRRDDRWFATDTDQAGMAASLAWLEANNIGPATVALFGAGGVSGAVMRAVKNSDWFLVFATRARDGWPEDVPPFVTVVVNAAGNKVETRVGAPKSRAWIDLHYVDVPAAPAGVQHLNGDLFFDAQATAQREFWNEME